MLMGPKEKEKKKKRKEEVHDGLLMRGTGLLNLC
jgi:hypothetical protein